MKMYKIYMLFILLLSTTALAERYIVGEQPTLLSACVLDGLRCDNSTTNCSITITSPNGSMLVVEDTVTIATSYISYHFDEPLINSGQYNYIITCSDIDGTTESLSGSFIVLDASNNYGTSTIIDYKFYILLLALFLILLALYIYSKSLVIGVASAAIGILTSIFLWFNGINMPTGIESVYRQLTPTLTIPIGIILAVFSTWLFYVAFTYKPKQNSNMEYADEDE